MGALVSNNAWGELAVEISDDHTQLLLSGGQGERFPNAAEGVSWFFVTLVDDENNIEIVKVTARNADTLTVERGWDNTMARTFKLGSRVELRPCAALFNDKVSRDEHTKAITELRTSLEEEDDKLYDKLDNDVTAIEGKLESDYATKKYVDDKFTKLDETMTENWLDKETAEETYLPLAGGTLTGALQLTTKTGDGFTLKGGDIYVRSWEDVNTDVRVLRPAR